MWWTLQVAMTQVSKWEEVDLLRLDSLEQIFMQSGILFIHLNLCQKSSWSDSESRGKRVISRVLSRVTENQAQVTMMTHANTRKRDVTTRWSYMTFRSSWVKNVSIPSMGPSQCCIECFIIYCLNLKDAVKSKTINL